VKKSKEIREELEEKPVDELQALIEELDEKIVDRKPISNTMLDRCRKKAVAQSILDDRRPTTSPSIASTHSSKPETSGQQGLAAFSR
jgi:hypothetical protein